MLGICRGCQFINVFFGGKLIDLRQREPVFVHAPATHEIQVTDAGAKAVLGKKLQVNSYHNMGFTAAELSPRLKAFAIASDHTVEGIFHPDYPIAAMMWHPERTLPQPEPVKKMVDAFLKGKLFWKGGKTR